MIPELRRFFQPVPVEQLPELGRALLLGVRLPCLVIVCVGPVISLLHILSGQADLAGIAGITSVGQTLFWTCFGLTYTDWGRRHPEALLLFLVTLVNVFTCFTGVQTTTPSPVPLLALVSPLTIAAFGPWRPSFSAATAASAIAVWIAAEHFAPGFPPVSLAMACTLAAASALIAACACQSQRRVWADLQRARRDASAGLEAKSSFLASMSHEIRTPMTAILGFAEELAQHVERGSSPPPAEIATIKRNGEQLLAMIDDILDLARLEAGRLEISTAPCAPRALVAEIAERFAASASAKGLRLETEVGSAVPREVLADALRLRQILQSLVGNAIKFTERGGVSVRVLRETDPTGAHESLVFEVLDSGIGLCPAVQRRMFEPFTQADGSMARRFGGAGIGLALAQRLAHALGGEISAAARPGGGSVFRLAVRLDLPSNASPAPADSAAGACELRGRVLLAEDGADNRALIARILQRAGLRVDLAENGREAHAKAMGALLSGTPYDVVLMDMQMPEMTGAEAVRALRADGYDAPIVALTAQALDGDRESCLAAGCDDYATKPIERVALLALVAGHLEKRRGR